MKKSFFISVLIGWIFLSIGIFSPSAYPATDSGQVPASWKVWSCWYWPYHDDYDPNLYDDWEAMYRYDFYTGSYSQWWEYNYHGMPQNPDPWWGHCHAWAGASVWEDQPKSSRKLWASDDLLIEFRVRDRKGLMVETYFNCANGYNNELYADNPSPGLFWRYLRGEIKGIKSLRMHDHGMGFVGELYYGDEVWNYPIYKYKVTYSGRSPNISGTMQVYVAGDGDPSYADSTSLYYQTFTYQFQGVSLASGQPIDSGYWTGSGPYSRPDAIWRPYYATTWMYYVENQYLDESSLSDILNP